MYAPPKPGYPVISAADLPQFDGIIFGIPTRFGNFPAQWKVRTIFPCLLNARLMPMPLRLSGIPLDSSGRRVRSRASTPQSSSHLPAKVAGRRRQSQMPSPLLCTTVFFMFPWDTRGPSLSSQTSPRSTEVRTDTVSGRSNILTSVKPGSPWGAGTLTNSDGSRQPSALELETAAIQGQQFYELLSRATN